MIPLYSIIYKSRNDVFYASSFHKIKFSKWGEGAVILLPNLKRNGYEDNMIIELNFIIQLVMPDPK